MYETTNDIIYSSGYNDEAKCYFCELIVQSWEADDDPWEEHYKHYPDCGFLKQFYRNNNQCTKRDPGFSNPPSTAKFMEKNDEAKYSHRTSLSSTQKAAVAEMTNISPKFTFPLYRHISNLGAAGQNI